MKSLNWKTATPNLDEEELVQREIVIPPPAFHEEPESLYKLYDDHIETLHETVESDFDRVASKLDRLSQFIHDSVTARASETNVELQQYYGSAGLDSGSEAR